MPEKHEIKNLTGLIYETTTFNTKFTKQKNPAIGGISKF